MAALLTQDLESESEDGDFNPAPAEGSVNEADGADGTTERRNKSAYSSDGEGDRRQTNGTAKVRQNGSSSGQKDGDGEEDDLDGDGDGDEDEDEDEEDEDEAITVGLDIFLQGVRIMTFF